VPFLLSNVFLLIAFAKKPGKKGYPQFKKHTRSVEYKTSGWALSADKRCLTFKDGFAAGKFKLIGSRDLHFYAPDEIKRVRVVRRADGYYAQFCINVERKEEPIPTGKAIGIDVGLNHFYTDSNGETVPNPRYLRQSEKALKRLQKRVSRKKKGSSNRKKAINKLGRKHLKVSRQRKDFAIKTAPGAVKSNDFVAYEELQVKNMVKNHKLAKSMSDAAWDQFAQWLEYFGKIYSKTVIAVAPQYTSQDCSACGNTVKKTLSTRTHICGCGTILDRDHNAGINILAKGLKQAGITLNTVGHTEINAWGQNDLYYEGGDKTEISSTDPSKNPRAFRPGSVNRASCLPPGISARFKLGASYSTGGDELNPSRPKSLSPRTSQSFRNGRPKL
jgi:putative transposase